MRKWLVVPVFLAFLLLAYWADNNAVPAWLKILYDFPNGDRVGHIFIYAGIAFLFNFALSGRKWKRIPLGSLLAFGMTVLEEASQFFFPSRTPDWVDLICGWLGVALATLPFIWSRKSQTFDSNPKP